MQGPEPGLAAPDEMTLDEARRIEAVATPPARALIVGIVASEIGVGVALRVARSPAAQLALAVAAPLLLAGLVALAWRLRRASPRRLALRRFAWGSLLLAAAVAFDVIVTAVKDPWLVIEANPFVRMLVDAGHPLGLVKAHAVACQLMVVVLLAALLAAVLAHVEALRVLAWSKGPRNRKEFVAAATRGSTDASPLFGVRPRDWREMRAHAWAIWLAAAFCLASLFGRTAYGLEWLGLGLEPRALVIGAILVATLGTISWAWSRAWRQGPPRDHAIPLAERAPVPMGRRLLEGFAALLLLAASLVAVVCVPDLRSARWALAVLDERIAAVSAEVEDARHAAEDMPRLEARVAGLEAAWQASPANRALPCQGDGSALVEEVRAVLEPHGGHVEVATALQRRRMKDFYDEQPIVVRLPDGGSATAAAVAALAASERLFVVTGIPSDSVETTVLAFAWRCDERDDPPYEPHVFGHGDDLAWPLRRLVERREDELRAWLAQRDRLAVPVALRRRQRALVEETARREQIVAALTQRRASAEGTAAGGSLAGPAPPR